VIDDEPDLRTLYELTLYGKAIKSTPPHPCRKRWKPWRVSLMTWSLPTCVYLTAWVLIFLKNLRLQFRGERCMVITAYGSAENAVESLKAGAFDYLDKASRFEAVPDCSRIGA